MTEREKKDRGLWYDANFNPELLKERDHAEELCFELNRTSPVEREKIQDIITKLLGILAREVRFCRRLMWITVTTAVSATGHL